MTPKPPPQSPRVELEWPRIIVDSREAPLPYEPFRRTYVAHADWTPYMGTDDEVPKGYGSTREAAERDLKQQLEKLWAFRREFRKP